MKRNIYDTLVDWKENLHRKPMIIRGARQVGKTYTIKEFGKNYFSNMVVLDFERDRSLFPIFEKDLDPYKIVQELEIHTGKRIIPGDTLLFFDEIQACERGLMSLRYFYEEMPEMHLIAAGSLLEFAISSISFPVGRVTFEWMYPMTFREFLIASNKFILVEKIPSVFKQEHISETLHRSLIEQLRLYFIIGGMPEAVKCFIDTGSLNEIKKIHEDIIYSYLQSFVKYQPRANIDSLEQILRVIPSKVGTQVKYTHIDKDRRIDITKKSLSILEKSLLLNPVYATSASGLPIGAETRSKIFKPIFLDIGLMQFICGIDPKDSLRSNDLNNIYNGALSEQFIGQELLAGGGSENHKLYYWNRLKKSSTSEIDFIIVRNGKIYPIEVKSGKKGLMKSMHIFLEEHPDIEKGFVLSSGIYKCQTDDKLIFAPIYSELK